MCGIAGWIDWEKQFSEFNARLILCRMVETLKQRGPDDEGMYLSGAAALGHRRLSVMDPANGRQPFCITVGGRKYIIVYNGEIYNTPELKQELASRGCKIRTACDTEVLLWTYIEYGEACTEKLNGIFAFAIWDEQAQRLFMARDRIGVKPLFFAVRNKALIFGSEIKTLLQHPAVEPKVNVEGMAEVLMIGPARTPGNGVFEGVEELRPGEQLSWSITGMKRKFYWRLESHEHTDSFEETVKNVRELFEDTVKRQLVSDVKVCTFLSGGLDSSALTAMAAKHFADNRLGKLSTYSVDYVDNDKYFRTSDFQPNNDAPWAEKMWKLLHTNHHRVLIDNVELAKSLTAAVLARDFPGMADVDTSLYLFSREIKRGATVALSGECADEIFGGYPWFYREDMINSEVFPWAPNPDIRLNWLSGDFKARIDLKEYVKSRYADAVAEIPYLAGEDEQEQRMRRIFYLSLTRWMPTLLDRKDRMSMAFGLEVRVPYCDHRIVEYAWNIPWRMKNYRNREKGLLREALTGLLPDDVLWRKKSPYPKTHHPEYLKIVRNWALDVLHDKESLLNEFIDAAQIRKIASQDLAASNMPWFGQLMGGAQLFAYIIQLDTWLKHYKVQIV